MAIVLAVADSGAVVASVIDTAVAVLHGRFNSVTENPDDCPTLEATKQHFASRTFLQHAMLTTALVKTLTFLDTSEAKSAAKADLSAARSNAVKAATAAVAAAAKLGAAPSAQEDESASPVDAAGGLGEASAASPAEAPGIGGNSLGTMRGAPAPAAMAVDTPQGNDSARQLAAAAVTAPAVAAVATAAAAATATAAAAATAAGTPPTTADNGSKQTAVEQPTAAAAGTVDQSWQPGLEAVAGNVLGYRFVPNTWLRPGDMSLNASMPSVLTSKGLFSVVKKDPLHLINLMRCFPIGHECSTKWIETQLGPQREWTTQKAADFRKLLTPVAKRLMAEHLIWKAAADAKHNEESSGSDDDTSLAEMSKRPAAAETDAEPSRKKSRRAGPG